MLGRIMSPQWWDLFVRNVLWFCHVTVGWEWRAAYRSFFLILALLHFFFFWFQLVIWLICFACSFFCCCRLLLNIRHELCIGRCNKRVLEMCRWGVITGGSQFRHWTPVPMCLVSDRSPFVMTITFGVAWPSVLADEAVCCLLWRDAMGTDGLVSLGTLRLMLVNRHWF